MSTAAPPRAWRLFAALCCAAADGSLRGLFTFTVFDAQGLTTCQDTVDAMLAPWFTSNAALPDAR